MAMDANQDVVATDAQAFATPVVGESRWPMAIAVLVLMAAALIAPPRLTILPGWLLAATEGLLLLALIVEDPGRIDRTGPWQRRTSIALVVVILASTLGATALLIYDLITGSPLTSQADQLLLAGAKVWLGNNIAFAFLYWEFDAGGPAVRAHGMPPYPDLAFPQQVSPDVAPPDWRPQFVDYLYVGFTTANAFSPTDHDARWSTGLRWQWARRRSSPSSWSASSSPAPSTSSRDGASGGYHSSRHRHARTWRNTPGRRSPIYRFEKLSSPLQSSSPVPHRSRKLPSLAPQSSPARSPPIAKAAVVGAAVVVRSVARRWSAASTVGLRPCRCSARPFRCSRSSGCPGRSTGTSTRVWPSSSDRLDRGREQGSALTPADLRRSRRGPERTGWSGSGGAVPSTRRVARAPTTTVAGGTTSRPTPRPSAPHRALRSVRSPIE